MREMTYQELNNVEACSACGNWMAAASIMHHFYIIASIKYVRKIDVEIPVYHNAEGINIYMFLIMGFLYLVIMSLDFAFHENLNFAFMIIGGIGLTGFLFLNKWLALFIKAFKKDKYYILETLRY